MQRSSPTPRPPRSTEAPAPTLPAGPPSLDEALARTREPDVSRAEVDVLLSVLALPPPSGEAARERARVLHEIMEDAWVGALVGSEGLRVAHAAVEALIELGFPYALEVPPELLAEARRARRWPARKERAHWGPEDWARHQRTGALLVGAAGLLECTGLLAYQALGWMGRVPESRVGALAGVLLLCGGVPAYTMTTRPVQRSRWLRRLLGVCAALPGPAWLAPLPFVLVFSLFSPEVLVYYLPVLGLGLMRVVGASRLYEVPPSEP